MMALEELESMMNEIETKEGKLAENTPAPPQYHQPTEAPMAVLMKDPSDMTDDECNYLLHDLQQAYAHAPETIIIHQQQSASQLSPTPILDTEEKFEEFFGRPYHEVEFLTQDEFDARYNEQAEIYESPAQHSMLPLSDSQFEAILDDLQQSPVQMPPMNTDVEGEFENDPKAVASCNTSLPLVCNDHDTSSRATFLLGQLMTARPDLDWTDPEKAIDEILMSTPLTLQALSGEQANTSSFSHPQQSGGEACTSGSYTANTQQPGPSVAADKGLKRALDDDDNERAGKHFKADGRLRKGECLFISSFILSSL